MWWREVPQELINHIDAHLNALWLTTGTSGLSVPLLGSETPKQIPNYASIFFELQNLSKSDQAAESADW